MVISYPSELFWIDQRVKQVRKNQNRNTQKTRVNGVPVRNGDDTIDLTDRVAGCLLLLYGQQLSRITAITTDQVTTCDQQVFIRFSRDAILIPEPLDGLLQKLLRDGRRYQGVGSPNTTTWLFPGMHPGRPLTASRLGERLRKLGLRAQPARRATLTDLAAHEQ